MDGTPTISVVKALFTSGSVFGTPVGTDGSCNAYTSPPSGSLSAGEISITGAAMPISLLESGASPNITYSGPTLQDPIYAPGATLNIEGFGGSDIAPFSGSVPAPTAIAGYTPPASLARTGYTATWTPGSASGFEVWIIGINPAVMGDTVYEICSGDDSGTLTVAPSSIAMIPLAYSEALLAAIRVESTVVDAAGAPITIAAASSVLSGPFTLSGS